VPFLSVSATWYAISSWNSDFTRISPFQFHFPTQQPHFFATLSPVRRTTVVIRAWTRQRKTASISSLGKCRCPSIGSCYDTFISRLFNRCAKTASGIDKVSAITHRERSEHPSRGVNVLGAIIILNESNDPGLRLDCARLVIFPATHRVPSNNLSLFT